MKIFQLALCDPETLAKFAPTPQLAEQISELFCETLTLQEGSLGNTHAQLALNSPSKYVMKPQREGGGNNLWEDEMVSLLKELGDSAARGTHILMRRLTPPLLPNRIIRSDRVSETIDTVSEVGLYSVYWTGDEKCNEVVGTLVRTKNSIDNEGGVMVGISAIDSPLFV